MQFQRGAQSPHGLPCGGDDTVEGAIVGQSLAQKDWTIITRYWVADSGPIFKPARALELVD